MKVALIGSRTFSVSVEDVFQGLKLAGINISEITGIISGGAVGADSVACLVANSLGVPCRVIRPNYLLNPTKLAPILRNKDIIDEAEFVLAFWDKKSKGTASALDIAKRTNTPFFIVSSVGDIQQKLF